MIQEILHTAHIAVTVLSAGASLLLAFLFFNSSRANSNVFTSKFLFLLFIASVVQAWEVLSAAYRSGRVFALNVPIDGAIVGLQGRFFELVIYCVVIWFLLRPETKKALDGGGEVATVSNRT